MKVIELFVKLISVIGFSLPFLLLAVVAGFFVHLAYPGQNGIIGAFVLMAIGLVLGILRAIRNWKIQPADEIRSENADEHETFFTDYKNKQ